jgi:hypothetical protein
MKNKRFRTQSLLCAIALIVVIGLSVVACDNGQRDLRYSIQVNNSTAARTLVAGDTVELWIRNIDVWEDGGNGQGLWLVSDGLAFMDDGGRLSNAGWFSVAQQDFVSFTQPSNVSYSSVEILIDTLRVNGTEYDFPDSGKAAGTRQQIFLGNLPPQKQQDHGVQAYPDNFPGFTITDSTVSLKIILTVEPDIIGTPNSTGYDSQGLADDPYNFIKIVGYVNQ